MKQKRLLIKSIEYGAYLAMTIVFIYYIIL